MGFRAWFYLLFIFFAPLTVKAQPLALPGEVLPFVMPSARAAGGGGYHAAFADDFNVFFANPAILARVKGQISIADVSFALTDLGMINMLGSYFLQTGSQDYISFFQASPRNGLDIGGPLAVGIIQNGFGAGIFNKTRMNLTWTNEEVPRSRLVFTEEFFVIGGYGFTFLDNGAVSGEFGLTLKLFFRGGNSFYVMLEKVKYFLEDAHKEIFERQIGGGGDAGVRFTFSTFSLGLVIKDPYSPAHVALFPNQKSFFKGGDDLKSGMVTIVPRLACGIAWRPAPPFWRHIISNFVITADFQQILFFLNKEERHPLLEFSAGFEVSILEQFSFRMGLNEMLPAAGFGVNLGIFQLDAAAFMIECGKTIWEAPVIAFHFSLLYRYDWPRRADE